MYYNYKDMGPSRALLRCHCGSGYCSKHTPRHIEPKPTKGKGEGGERGPRIKYDKRR